MTAVVPQQYTSGESERAEAARGCGKCGEKGHNARTCTKKEAAPEPPKPKGFTHPCPDGERLARVRTASLIMVFDGTDSWDHRDDVFFNEGKFQNKKKWQIWTKGPWVFVWHEDKKIVTRVPLANVSCVFDFDTCPGI